MFLVKFILTLLIACVVSPFVSVVAALFFLFMIPFYACQAVVQEYKRKCTVRANVNAAFTELKQEYAEDFEDWKNSDDIFVRKAAANKLAKLLVEKLDFLPVEPQTEPKEENGN